MHATTPTRSRPTRADILANLDRDAADADALLTGCAHLPDEELAARIMTTPALAAWARRLLAENPAR